MNVQYLRKEADFGRSLLSRNDGQISTYEDFVPLTPAYVAQVDTVSDVQCAIVEAAERGLKVRPFGAGQSWAPELMTEGVCLDLRRLNRIHSVNSKLKTIVADAGATLADVNRALASKGLSLPSVPFRAAATIGGIVSTATHGTSHKWGTVSDFVRSIDLVDASGQLRQLDPHSSPDEVRAARVSVGELGAITRLELQAIDMPWVRFQKLTMDLPDFLSQLGAIQAEYDHIWVHWELGADKMTLDCLETSAEPRKGFHSYVDDRERRWEPLSPPMSLLSTPLRRAARGVLSVVRPGRDGAGDVYSPGQSETHMRISLQYAVPAEDMEQTIETIKNSGAAERYRSRDLEIKFVKGSDQSFLGPNADGDSALFNLYWIIPREEKYTALIEFENLMKGLNARPHWGKYHETPTRDYMRNTFPQWDKFERVREKFDPTGLFSKI